MTDFFNRVDWLVVLAGVLIAVWIADGILESFTPDRYVLNGGLIFVVVGMCARFIDKLDL